MVAETTRRFDRLEAQAAQIVDGFRRAGFEFVAPAIIQPADAFLDTIGESLRNRTYVFTDPAGHELCLRPDVTVPAARLYRERHPKTDPRRKYCYNGPVFRYQEWARLSAPSAMDAGGPAAVGPDVGSGSPGDATADTSLEVQPREFRQAGIEAFGDTDRERADAEVFALTISALRDAGLKAFTLTLGDLGLLFAVIDALDIPERWRLRLRAACSNPERFQGELDALRNPARSLAKSAQPEGLGALISALSPSRPQEAAARVEDFIREAGMTFFGNRTLAEVTESLLEAAADLHEKPLAPEAAQLIQSYMSIRASPRAAGARIADLASTSGVDIAAALDAYNRRIDLLAQAGISWDSCVFAAPYGRDLAYYTGFVFQVEVPEYGRGGHLAGGGRYDQLLNAAGGHGHVPAVGAAIHTERLLRAVEEGA